MCGRYCIDSEMGTDEMQRFIEICNRTRAERAGSIIGGDIHPNDLAPVIYSADGNAKAGAFRWGFNVDKRCIINARSETCSDKAMFRAHTSKRCLMPAYAYYEWSDHSHVRHAVREKQGNIIYLKGLYRLEEDQEYHFVILTQEAEGEHRKVHSRMPLCALVRQEARAWLTESVINTETDRIIGDSLIIRPQEPEQIGMFDEI